MSSIPEPKRFHGSGYLMENVGRALRDLIDPSKSYAERISNACWNAHRPNRYDETVGAMSYHTLKAWDECKPTKRIEEMTPEELDAIANNLISYIVGMCQDNGIAAAGQDPAEYLDGTHLSTYTDGDVMRERRREQVANGA